MEEEYKLKLGRALNELTDYRHVLVSKLAISIDEGDIENGVFDAEIAKIAQIQGCIAATEAEWEGSRRG